MSPGKETVFSGLATLIHWDIHLWGHQIIMDVKKGSLFVGDSVAVENPHKLFQQWFCQEKDSPHIINPSIMCLSTASKSGNPSGRCMLCTSFDENGFKFFTDQASRKGCELAENPFASITYFWPPSRSVRIEGCVEKVMDTEAEQFFQNRPYEQQIDAVCSQQSKVIEGRHVLVEKAEEMRERYPPGCVPKPNSLCAYLLKPERIEFYQSSEGKLQERLRFRRLNFSETVDNRYVYQGENDWVYEILAP